MSRTPMDDTEEHADDVSFVIPAKNESRTIGCIVKDLANAFDGAEIIVVDDGSSDGTGELARAAGAQVVTHPYSMGNGAAIKSGLRHATRDIVVFLDADGQHRPADAHRLIERIRQGYDLVIGARGFDSQASFARGIGNWLYGRLASYVVGHRIADLTSGFRAMRREHALRFLALLPNGFSAPTTTTMAFFRAGHAVSFVPIQMPPRAGRSHIRLLHDAGRFLLIIFRTATLYSPLKIFFPAALMLLASGIAYYLYTYLTVGRFTNFGALLLISALVVFLVGLVSEQITTLVYMQAARDQPDSRGMAKPRGGRA